MKTGTNMSLTGITNGLEVRFNETPDRSLRSRIQIMDPMKNQAKPDALQREYLHRLLSDRSVDDKMPFFTQAKRIFDLLKRKSRGKKKR